MSKTGSAAKVKLNSFDDLFGKEQPQTGTEQVQEIALLELHEYKGHPFKVLDDEKMQETVESIKEHGVLMSGIARPMKDGGYEIIAGHRRRHACEIVGLDTIPMLFVIIRMMKPQLSWWTAIFRGREKATVWMRLEKLPERVQKQYKDIFTLPTYRMHF